MWEEKDGIHKTVEWSQVGNYTRKWVQLGIFPLNSYLHWLTMNFLTPHHHCILGQFRFSLICQFWNIKSNSEGLGIKFFLSLDIFHIFPFIIVTVQSRQGIKILLLFNKY